jgi:calcineurin-like phosphoesterase family protein
MVLEIDYKKVWVTSDPHFSHNNICRATTSWRNPDGSVPLESTRDFSSVEEMNHAIVNNINEVVNENDVLICLGDWSFNGPENVKKFRDMLNCNSVYLVLGNHDKHVPRRSGIFSGVFDYMRLKYMGEKIECFHYPIHSWRGMHGGNIHIHGHVHSLPHQKITGGRRMDVGMDGHPEFRPYDLLNEVILPMKQITFP